MRVLEEFAADGPGGALLRIPSPVNAHTHCADAGLKVGGGMTLGSLVAPPDGLKFRYLRDTPDGVIERNMRSYSDGSRRNGISAFVDFREGG